MRSLFYVLDTLFPPRATELLVRSATPQELMSLLHPRTLSLNESEVTTLLSYKNPLVQACVMEAKFYRNKKAQQLLGEVLAAYIKEYLPLPIETVVMIPIPLGKKRRQERGYNQVEEIARFSLKTLPSQMLTTFLVRTRATVAQSTLSRQGRKENMEGAFKTYPNRTLSLPLDSSCIYVLLDDVVTTGATLLAASKAIKQGGLEKIIVLALAH